jgi:hypothetical protein
MTRKDRNNTNIEEIKIFWVVGHTNFACKRKQQQQQQQQRLSFVIIAFILFFL